jgi:acyl-CoA dehydrogenase
VIIAEELAYGCTGISTAVSANDLAEAPLILAANDSIKKKFLGRMTEEPLAAAVCIADQPANQPSKSQQSLAQQQTVA